MKFYERVNPGRKVLVCGIKKNLKINLKKLICSLRIKQSKPLQSEILTVLGAEVDQVH